MSLTTELFVQKREQRTGDGAGGKNKSYVVFATGLPATINYYRHYRQMQIEQGAHNSSGPGIQTQNRRLITFHLEDYPQGFPTILRGDHLVTAEGVEYNVLFVRPYDETLQIDGEVLQ